LHRFIGIALATLVALAGLSIAFGTWYRVDAGSRAVILRNGVVVGVAGPGLGFKLPLVDRVETIPVRTRLEAFPDMQVYSRDQQPATMRLSVNLRALPDRVAELQAEYGSLDAAVERAVRPRVEHEARVVFAGTAAVDAVRQRRRLAAEMEEAIRSVMPPSIRLDSVQVESLVFSKDYEQAMARRAAAADGCGANR
jgi:regulator of protease activity HflC (stomatin/prohibitin superfamily)